MSEIEKKERDDYQRKRKKRIYIQAVFIIIFALVTIFSSLTFVTMDKNTYVSYIQNGNAIYKAYLKDNEFYDVDYLNGSHAYVTSLIDRMTADFYYDMRMDADDVNFKYSYRVEAQLEIKDKTSNAAIFNPVYEIIPEKSGAIDGNGLSIRELVDIDYNKYNNLAKKFLSAYALDGTTSTLVVRMYVDVVGVSESFASDSNGKYTIEVYIPLVQATIKPETSTTVPAGEQKVLACDNSSQGIFKTISLISGSVTLILVAILALFVVMTRNNHIDYARKVKRLLSNYKSYIQVVSNPLSTDGYRILNVKTFNEMLEIRDTVQLPILMYENEDRTCSQFFIATPSNILYLFEVKVEDEEFKRETNDYMYCQTPVQNESDNEGKITEKVCNECANDLKDESAVCLSESDEENKTENTTVSAEPENDEYSEHIYKTVTMTLQKDENIYDGDKTCKRNYRLVPSSKRTVKIIKHKS